MVSTVHHSNDLKSVSFITLANVLLIILALIVVIIVTIIVINVIIIIILDFTHFCFALNCLIKNYLHYDFDLNFNSPHHFDFH